MAAAPAPVLDAATSPAPVAPPAPPADDEQRWLHLRWLPCTLAVEIPVPHLSVGDILRLAPQALLDTAWQQNADVPIRANGRLIAWAEFEGVDEHLAVRITRLA
ncbi:MAG: FliM/FliN family flagellar motor switch protein [Terriglobales bacterium]